MNRLYETYVIDRELFAKYAHIEDRFDRADAIFDDAFEAIDEAEGDDVANFSEELYEYILEGLPA